MSSVHVVVFGYNLNQAVDMHDYLKVNVHLHKKPVVSFIMELECLQFAKTYKPSWSVDEVRVGAVIFIFFLEVHVLPSRQSHQHTAELWKYAEDNFLKKSPS